MTQGNAPAFDIYAVWEIYAYAWTEIGIEDVECLDLARKAGLRRADLAACAADAKCYAAARTARR